MLKKIPLIIFLVFTSNAFAGVTYHEIPGNSIIPLEQVEIRLVEETIKVDDEKAFVSMTFENLSDKEILLKVGFPFSKATELPERDSWGKIIKKKIVVKVDGKEIPIVQIATPEDVKKKLGYDYTGREFDYVYSWQIIFKPKEKKTISCIYYIQWAASVYTPDGDSFTYITKPGALWNGTIKKADFSIELDKFLSSYLKQKVVRLEVEPKGYKVIDNKIVEWHFTNWEPTEDLSITVWEK